MDIELWDEMRSMENRFDDLFRMFVGPRARVLFPALPTAWRRPFIPLVDEFVRGDELVFRLELPGIDPVKDVKLYVKDAELVVSGDRKAVEKIEGEHYYRMEARYGAFERRLPVPEGTDEKKVKATYKEGILEIAMPAKPVTPELPKAKTIPIKIAA